MGCASRFVVRAAVVVAACGCGAAGRAADAPAEKLAVKRLLPAGATAGGTLVVKAEGTFPQWPVRVWTDRGGTTWTPREEKGSFDVSVAPDGVGVHRVRIHDDRGAAAVLRFVVGTVPEVAEAEPNDRLQEPQAVSTLPVTVNGVLEKAEDVDGYGVQLVAGQTLVAAVDAHGGPAAPLDAVLEIVDDRGGYLARNLDARGLDPRIVYTAKRSGRHVVRVYGFPADPNSTIGYSGGADHVYRLTLTTGGFVAATLPAAVSRGGTTAVAAGGWNLPAGLAALPLAAAAPGETVWAAFPGVAGTVPLPVVAADRLPLATPEAAAAVEPPLVASGLFTAADQRLVVRIAARNQQPLLVGVEANGIGSEAEAVLEIRGADGSILVSKSDREPPDAWTPPADGEYGITVRDRRGTFGPGHFFRLPVVASEPGLAATCETDAVAGTVGNTLDLAIAVERLRGWSEPVEFALAEPPAGVTADPVTSAADGDSAKKVTLKVKVDVAFNGPLAVVARRPDTAAAGAGAPAAAVRFGKEKLPVVWVSVAP
jgi:hypothetical protein